MKRITGPSYLAVCALTLVGFSASPALAASPSSPTSAAAQRPASCDATTARITAGKAYRLWVERQCKEFRKLRAALGRVPDITTAEKFAQNGQDYADHEEALDRLLFGLSEQLGTRTPPNKDIEKGIDHWVDSIDAWYQANASLISEIRQASLDFHTFVQRVGQISALRARVWKIAKHLGLRECASI